MNILQPLTIHTSVPIRPLATTRKLIQMYVLSTQSALLRCTGTEVFKPCQPLLLPSSRRACAQVVTFLYGGRRPLLWRGSSADYNSDERVWKPAKQIRKWSPARAPSGRWFSWLLLGFWAEPCLFSLTAAWTLPLLGRDLFGRGRCCGCRICIASAGRRNREPVLSGHAEDGRPPGDRVRKLSALRWTVNPAALNIDYNPLHERVRGSGVAPRTHRSEDVDVLVAGDQVGVLGGTCGRFQFVPRQHPNLCSEDK